MSDRLTSTDKTSLSKWAAVALPAALIMIVLRESWDPASYETRGIRPGLWALFALQLAAMVRGMLPKKSPELHTTLAACLGALVASWLFRDQISSPDLAWLLALMGWNFFFAFDETSIPPRVLSGLCAGVACILTEETLIVSLPLLILNILENRKKDKGLRNAAVQWALGFFIGIFPVMVGRFSPPVPSADPDRLEAYLNASNIALGKLPWIIWPFCLLGCGVSFFQARKTFLTLFLPFFILLPAAVYFFPTSSLSPMWLVPISGWTSYGLYRVAKGIEQGVRNVSPKEAPKAMGGALFAVLLAYAVWAGLEIYLFI